jgi:hypothetical protein
LQQLNIWGVHHKGWDFFHVEVQEEENRRGYMKFLDNYVVLTIEEGGDPYKGGCEQSENVV